jgi:hypothetical protein
MMNGRLTSATVVHLKKIIARYPKRLIILVAFVMVMLGASLFAISRRVAGSVDGSGPAALSAVQHRIEQHYLLPADETPALATVTDTSKLTSPLFKTARNGDKVLIYQTNRIVIIYRPSIDRIIAVGPVQIDTPQGGTSK